MIYQVFISLSVFLILSAAPTFAPAKARFIQDTKFNEDRFVLLEPDRNSEASSLSISFVTKELSYIATLKHKDADSIFVEIRKKNLVLQKFGRVGRMYRYLRIGNRLSSGWQGVVFEYDKKKSLYRPSRNFFVPFEAACYGGQNCSAANLDLSSQLRTFRELYYGVSSDEAFNTIRKSKTFADTCKPPSASEKQHEDLVKSLATIAISSQSEPAQFIACLSEKMSPEFAKRMKGWIVGLNKGWAPAIQCSSSKETKFSQSQGTVIIGLGEPNLTSEKLDYIFFHELFHSSGSPDGFAIADERSTVAAEKCCGPAHDETQCEKGDPLVSSFGDELKSIEGLPLLHKYFSIDKKEITQSSLESIKIARSEVQTEINAFLKSNPDCKVFETFSQSCKEKFQTSISKFQVDEFKRLCDKNESPNSKACSGDLERLAKKPLDPLQFSVFIYGRTMRSIPEINQDKLEVIAKQNAPALNVVGTATAIPVDLSSKQTQREAMERLAKSNSDTSFVEEMFKQAAFLPEANAAIRNNQVNPPTSSRQTNFEAPVQPVFIPSATKPARVESVSLMRNKTAEISAPSKSTRSEDEGEAVGATSSNGSNGRGFTSTLSPSSTPTKKPITPSVAKSQAQKPSPSSRSREVASAVGAVSVGTGEGPSFDGATTTATPSTSSASVTSPVSAQPSAVKSYEREVELNKINAYLPRELTNQFLAKGKSPNDLLKLEVTDPAKWNKLVEELQIHRVRLFLNNKPIGADNPKYIVTYDQSGRVKVKERFQK